MSEDHAHRLYEIGRDAMTEGRFADAIVAFEQSAVISEHFKTLELLGESWIRLGGYEQALAPLERAAVLNRQVRARSLLAKALLMSGNSHRAAQVAASVLSEAPTNRIARDVHERASRSAG